MSELKFKKILLKISGEALLGEQEFGIDPKPVEMICNEIKKVHDQGVQLAIVVGGGNIFRGMKNSQKLGMDQASGDYVGMLATVINALGVAEVLEQLGVEVRVQTALLMQQIAELYIKNKAVRHLEKGRVVIFGCGTGSPFFSTDTAAALRAAEIGADVVLKATLVDGVYDKDPKKNFDAVKYESIGYEDVLNKNLQVMDSTAASMCKENNIPLLVFSIENPNNIYDAIMGISVGTIVK